MCQRHLGALTMNGETMEDDFTIDDLEEEGLRPLDDERTEHLVAVAALLEEYADDGSRSTEERGVLSVAAQHILQLTAMVMAGYSLYTEYYRITHKFYEEMILNQTMAADVDPDLANRFMTSAIQDFFAVKVNPNIVFEKGPYADGAS
jgi:hypothetical protein